MTLRDQLVDRLERENDELRARVKQLEEMIGVSIEVPPEFQLTANEGRLFGLLLNTGLMTKRAFMDAAYLHGQDEAEIKIVDVFVCKLRKKLKPWRIEVETVWGQGYRMPAASKAIAQTMLDLARAA